MLRHKRRRRRRSAHSSWGYPRCLIKPENWVSRAWMGRKQHTHKDHMFQGRPRLCLVLNCLWDFVFYFYDDDVIGGRSDETVATRLVGPAYPGSPSPAVAQSPARRIVFAQRSKVWSSLALVAGLPGLSRASPWRHCQAHGAPLRRSRLRLPQVSHAP